ncbi:MAG: FHA domain-containing protein [Betaproteobacteria bacterium]|nr:FHA domain-containing protein [Betaproteobacteria bacterium]
MAKLVVNNGETLVAQLHLDAPRVVIGRGEQCQIRLASASVSKEHAAVLSIGNDHILEDLKSTNGTKVNGASVSRHVLQNEEIIEIGEFRIRYMNHRALKDMDFDRTMIFSGDPNLGVAFSEDAAAAAANTDQVSTARAVRVSFPLGGVRGLKGAHAGKEISLEPVLRRFGQPGRATVAIMRRPQGYVLMNVEGNGAVLNSRNVGAEWPMLQHKDLIEIAGEQYTFFLVGK